MLVRTTGLLMLAGILSMMLFSLKYEVQALEARLGALDHSIQDNQETLHLLAAEWAHLNDPARLRHLAEQHLDLVPLSPQQVIRPDRLAYPIAENRANPTPDQAAPKTTPEANTKASTKAKREAENQRKTKAMSDAEFAAAIDDAIAEDQR